MCCDDEEDDEACACFWFFIICIIIILILCVSVDINFINIMVLSLGCIIMLGIIIIILISLYNWLTHNCSLPRLILPTVNISISLQPNHSGTSLETYKMKHTDVTCTVCMEDIEINSTCKKIPECNHEFHSKCIEPWLKNNKTCPNCREEIN